MSNSRRKTNYTKPHLSIEQQILQLESRGLYFENIEKAKHYLSHINYYRLTAYWLPYEDNHSTHQFKPNIFFEDIIKDYVFDRELRLLVLDAIERIEVSVRTKMTHVLTEKYGSHPQLYPEIFHCPLQYAKSLNKLHGEYLRSKEIFIKHFKDNYLEKIPPMWVAVELMTLGQISHWYSNIKERSDRKEISKLYNIDELSLKSFLHNLTIIRNISAHHARLWNRRFTFSLKLARNPEELSQSFNKNSDDIKSLYNILVFIKHFMDKINPEHQWGDRLKILLERSEINTLAMGFPTNWEELPIWT